MNEDVYQLDQLNKLAADSSEGSSQATEITASIVTYETPLDQLERLLQSLSGRLLPRHIIVVDNSADESIRSCAGQFGVQYERPGLNVGFGAGHNRALITCQNVSKYHVMANPDVTCGSEVIDDLYRFMEGHHDVGLVMPRILYPDGTEQRLCKLLPTPYDLFIRRFLGSAGRSLFTKQLKAYELRHLDMSVCREVPCLSGCFMFLRSSVLREVGMFDERYFMYMEDFDLCRRIGSYYKTVFYPGVSVTHRYAKGSYRSMRLLKCHIDSAIRYFMKWGWFYDPERKILNRRTAPLDS